MSTDAPWGPDGTQPTEDHTDPLLPAITDDMLPPPRTPQVPRLDDRALAEMLAELEGDDFAPIDDSPHTAPAPSPVPPVAMPRKPARRQTAPLPTPRPDAAPTQRPVSAPIQRSASVPIPRPSTGQVARPGYRNFRPPVGRAPEGPSLTGLTRRSRGKIGSVVFTIVFVAIFLLILLQAVTSVLATGGGH